MEKKKKNYLALVFFLLSSAFIFLWELGGKNYYYRDNSGIPRLSPSNSPQSIISNSTANFSYVKGGSTQLYLYSGTINNNSSTSTFEKKSLKVSYIFFDG